MFCTVYHFIKNADGADRNLYNIRIAVPAVVAVAIPAWHVFRLRLFRGNTYSNYVFPKYTPDLKTKNKKIAIKNNGFKCVFFMFIVDLILIALVYLKCCNTYSSNTYWYTD